MRLAIPSPDQRTRLEPAPEKFDPPISTECTKESCEGVLTNPGTCQ